MVGEGANAAVAIENTVTVARHTEQLGYRRIWLAEHHNMEHIASSATAVLIGHVAGKTTGKIRVGSGGIMLPNHSPLVIAEQFGTLETMYPGRIDLGLGRAPGTDQVTAAALRRGDLSTSFHFKEDIEQLQQYFNGNNSSAKVRAFPGEGLNIPIWILGSSTDSAFLAARLGLPYAFAAHFAPAQFLQALSIYRNNFTPSVHLAQPYVMACVNVMAADTDEEAEYLSTSLVHLFLGIITNTRSQLKPPSPLPDIINSAEAQYLVNDMLSYTFKGSKNTIKNKLKTFIANTQINELMITSHIYDLQAKLKSFTLVQEAMEEA